MYRQPVDSSNISSIGYDAQAMILEVEFKHGGVYQYFQVPSHVYSSLMSAASIGSYLHSHVKPYYNYEKIA
jgi:hypothetical protein